jgi:hypothetical protein
MKNDGRIPLAFFVILDYPKIVSRHQIAITTFYELVFLPAPGKYLGEFHFPFSGARIRKRSASVLTVDRTVLSFRRIPPIEEGAREPT